MADVLSTVQLKGLKDHKYSSHGTSLVEPVMQKFWRWLVEQVPLWWAPNAITLVGLILNVGTSLLLMAYSPDAKHETPKWVCTLTGLGLFLYQCLDAIDGKQARRTNSASPLGELFDHGCDAVSIVFVMIAVCVCIQLGDYPHTFLFVGLFYMFLFYAAHWQTYCTGTLQFGLIDVTEGQLAIIGIYLGSGIVGPNFWLNQIPLIGLPFKLIPVVACSLSGLLTCYWYFSVIFIQGGVGKSGSTVAGTSVLGPIIPIGAHILSAVFIMKNSEVNLFENHPVLFLLTWGMISSKITCKLVVAHMSRSEMELLDTSFLGPLVLLLNQYFSLPFPEYFLLWVAFIYCTADLMLYAVRVCKQICDYLNIYCFKISSPSSKSAAGASSQATSPSTEGQRSNNGTASSTDNSRPVTRSVAGKVTARK